MAGKRKGALRLLLYCCAVIFATVSSLYAQSPVSRTPVESDFSSSQWKLVGPFAAGSNAEAALATFDKDFLATQGGEADFQAASDPAAIGGSVRVATAVNGTLNLAKLFPDARAGIVYASMDFDAAGGGYSIYFGSNHAIRVWINGDLALENTVDRALDGESEEARVVLHAGKNRLLVKLAGVAESWGFSCSLRRMEAFETELDKVAACELQIPFPQAEVPAGQPLVFSVSLKPALAVSVPVDFRLTRPDGSVVAAGRSLSDTDWHIALQSSKDELLTLHLRPAPDIDLGLGAKFGSQEIKVYYLHGNAEHIMSDLAIQARQCAADLTDASDPGDIRTTLLFLADRLENKLHPYLEKPSLVAAAPGFVQEIVQAAAQGKSALERLLGLRQYAYRSSLDNSIQPYSVYLPQSYDSSKKYGMVVVLHGAQWDDFTAANSVAVAKPDDMIIIGAMGRGDLFYRSQGEQDVLDVMDRVMARYSVDPDRVYLTGSSMGGMGTWYLGQMYPDRFAAMAAFMGRIGPHLLSNLRNLPTFVVHGDIDETVTPDADRRDTALMKEWGFPVRYDELAGVDHEAFDAWVAQHSVNDLLNWFRQYTRTVSPQHVTAVIPRARYGRHYWVTVSDLDTSGPLDFPVPSNAPDHSAHILLSQPGTIDAQRTSPSALSIKSTRITALTINFVQAGMQLERAIELTIDGQAMRFAAGSATASLSKNAEGKWIVLNGAADPRKKPLARHDGGGMADLFVRPLIIVYGTQNLFHTGILKEIADGFSDWTQREYQQGGTAGGAILVRADAELTEQEIASHSLLIIGYPGDNSVARRYASMIVPYYHNGVPTINRQQFAESGLGIVSPNPENPTMLLGFMELPDAFVAKQPSLQNWFRTFFVARIVNILHHNNLFEDSDSVPGTTPDVMVFGPDPVRDLWSGWFDQNWANLHGR